MMTLILKFSHCHKEVIRSIGFMDRTGCLNIWLLRALFAIWILASAGSRIHAQVVPDGATVTLANVTKNLSGTVTVGTNVSFTRLMLTDNVLLTHSTHGVIGRNATAKSNEVQLLNATARWQMGGDLSVGSSGAGNRLVASNGAFVNNNSGILGNGASSSNNVALITGSGSLWSNRLDLLVGVSGRDNQMIVSNGAAVVSRIGNIGGNAGSSNNLVVVTGNGSVWTNHSDLNVGVNERYNRLIIEDGGLVGDGDGRVGAGVFSDGSEALVTGAGSLWSSRFDLAVGLNSANNRLVVSNAAAVTAGNNGRVGVSSGSTGNVAVVTGSGSLWSNQFELYLGEGSPGNRMEVRDGGRVVSSNSYVGYFGASNVALVTGAGSVWNNRAGMFVGHARPDNQLVVSDGGLVISSNTVLGVLSGSTNNLLCVSGAGSVWTNRGLFTVGQQSAGNRLEVRDGGRLSLTSCEVGQHLGSDGNEVLIADSGSLLNVDYFVFGNFGASNRLRITGGGSLKSGIAAIGRNGTGLNNEAIIADAGSSMSSDLLYLGSSGSGVLLLTNGGMFKSPNADTLAGPQGIIMGFSPESTNNRILVDGGTLRAANVRGESTLDIRGGTNVLNAGLVDVDRLVLTNRGAVSSFPVFVNGDFNGVPFARTTPLTYPSTIATTGLLGRVTKVSVTLSNFYCGAPAKVLDVLLVSPTGQKVMLMSDAGQSLLSGRTLTFDDSAPTLIPNNLSLIASGTYRPTDYDPGDTLPTPAPTGPYSSSLSAFNGADPNGLWSLYFSTGVVVPEPTFMRAWRLTITTDEAPLTGPATFELNGGTLITRGAVISNGVPFVVGGPGGVPASWEARAGLIDTFVARDLLVGNNSSFNQLVIPSGAVIANQNVVVGSLIGGSSNNLLHVTGGTLRVLSPGRVLDLRGGTNRIDAGLVDVNRLVATNTGGQFELNGGTLRTTSTTIANGGVCIIGGGSSLATLQLLGGEHTFANNLTIATNGSLIGTGVIDGTVTLSAGGGLTPGAPIGRMDVLGSVILQGAVNLQINKSGGVRTSDQVSATGAIFYGGTLNVTDIGTEVLSAGDRFFLFNGTPYIGAFTTLNLPPLVSGLSWRNNLAVDGSIEITTAAVSTPGFSAINSTGTNVVFTGTNGLPNANFSLLTATNVELPLSDWIVVLTNHFDALGRFQITNPVTPADRQRYFRLVTP